MILNLKRKWPKIECFILIVDEETLKIVSNTISLADLM